MLPCKPAFIIQPGAWHPGALYQPLVSALQQRGFEVYVPATPSLSTKGVTWEADIGAVVALATPLFDEGKEFVLVGHCYGGVPSSAAVENKEVTGRAAVGKRGGFRHIIYLSAVVVPQKGMTVLDMVGGKWFDWHVEMKNDNGETEQLFVKDEAKEFLYHDLPHEQAEACFNRLKPHSHAVYTTPFTYTTADITIPKTYVIHEQDKAVPAAVQEQWAGLLYLKTASINASHSAFASKAEEPADDGWLVSGL
ncbi:alpha/beta-hydrolase [Thozetella sp. PMI_491]|nr:alpha/beta-hydrolase [Thozetella sp. PMI_491]